MPTERLLYFMPEWDDRYDPEFDFHHDTFSERHVTDVNSDLYAHHLLEHPPYDGILFSLGNLFKEIEKSKSLDAVTIRGHRSIQDFYRLSDTRAQVLCFGDCGAFNYINLHEPPPKFSPVNVAYLYNKLGFDLGVSVDHLVVESIAEVDAKGNKSRKPLSQYEKRRRIKLTLDNAEKFLDEVKENNYSFTPIGSAQGYAPKSYRDSVTKLIEMGYDYIALGGLVRRDTKSVVEIVKTVSPVLKGRRLHLLGIMRPEQNELFKELGVTSIDSASYFRKAWLRSNQNYLAPDGHSWYAAIRVPIVDESRLKTSEVNKVRLRKMETECLRVLHEYDRGTASLELTLDTVLEYDKLFERRDEDCSDLRADYARTLAERPWRVCRCPICCSVGIDVVIFRRTNRNKRRGLHNTLIAYEKMM